MSNGRKLGHIKTKLHLVQMGAIFVIYNIFTSLKMISLLYRYPKYLAPEVLLVGYQPAISWFENPLLNSDEGLALFSSKAKSDIWSIGFILLEMALGIELLSEARAKLCHTLRKVSRFKFKIH